MKALPSPGGGMVNEKLEAHIYDTRPTFFNQDVSDAKWKGDFQKMGLDVCKVLQWLFLLIFLKMGIFQRWMVRSRSSCVKAVMKCMWS